MTVHTKWEILVQKLLKSVELFKSCGLFGEPKVVIKKTKSKGYFQCFKFCDIFFIQHLQVCIIPLFEAQGGYSTIEESMITYQANTDFGREKNPLTWNTYIYQQKKFSKSVAPEL
jgi:hypothetical protein